MASVNISGSKYDKSSQMVFLSIQLPAGFPEETHLNAII